MGKYLTEKQRYQLEAYLKAGMSKSEIALHLGCCRATVYNEIKRGTVQLYRSDLSLYETYCADAGQRVQEENQSNKGRIPIAIFDFKYLDEVEHLIADLHYSPYAVVCHFKTENPEYKHLLCETSIYNYIHKNRFRRRLEPFLPYRKKPRRKPSDAPRIARNHLSGKSIEDRPKTADSREQIGHWEIDTVYSGKGKGNACLLVLSERMSRYEEIYKMPDRTSKSVLDVLNTLERCLGHKAFREKYKTFTCDNGTEFLDFDALQTSCINGRKRTDFYFCHSYSSWERGTNENQNKLIRRFVPKGDSIADYSDEQIKEIEYWINHLPRKLFGGLCSADLYG